MDYGIWTMESSIWITLIHTVMDRKAESTMRKQGWEGGRRGRGTWVDESWGYTSSAKSCRVERVKIVLGRAKEFHVSAITFILTGNRLHVQDELCALGEHGPKIHHPHIALCHALAQSKI